MPDDNELAAAIAALSPAEQAELESALSGQKMPVTEEDLAFEKNAQRGPLERFAEPFVGAVKGIGGLAATAGKVLGGDMQAGLEGITNIGVGLGQAQLGQLEKAKADAREGRDGMGVLHTAAAGVPIVGPMVGDFADAIQDGNYAGAAGQATLAAMPLIKPAKILNPVASALTKRAAVRALEAIGGGPAGSTKLLSTLEKSPGLIEDLGIGSRRTLAERAKGLKNQYGKTVEDFQTIGVPVDTTPAIDAVKARAAQEVAQFPSAIPGGPPVEVSGNPALKRALDKGVGALQAVGTDPPAGELFKFRKQLGGPARKAYARQVGDVPPPSVEAAGLTRDSLSKVLHDALPETKTADAAYSNWAKISTRLGRQADIDISQAGKAAFGDYLKGRLIAGVIGGSGAGLFGGPAGAGAGALVGGGGALIGSYLAKSPFWDSLRAVTYAKIARHINAGNMSGAFDTLTDAATTYAVTEETSRRAKAQKALESQGQGVVAP